MKHTLQLKLSQHLTLTPQLQQSIRLLQLSTLELNAEVERLLQENPLLEKAEDDEGSAPRISTCWPTPAATLTGAPSPARVTMTTSTFLPSRLPPARCAITSTSN